VNFSKLISLKNKLKVYVTGISIYFLLRSIFLPFKWISSFLLLIVFLKLIVDIRHYYQIHRKFFNFNDINLAITSFCAIVLLSFQFEVLFNRNDSAQPEIKIISQLEDKLHFIFSGNEVAKQLEDQINTSDKIKENEVRNSPRALPANLKLHFNDQDALGFNTEKNKYIYSTTKLESHMCYSIASELIASTSILKDKNFSNVIKLQILYSIIFNFQRLLKFCDGYKYADPNILFALGNEEKIKLIENSALQIIEKVPKGKQNNFYAKIKDKKDTIDIVSNLHGDKILISKIGKNNFFSSKDCLVNLKYLQVFSLSLPTLMSRQSLGTPIEIYFIEVRKKPEDVLINSFSNKTDIYLDLKLTEVGSSFCYIRINNESIFTRFYSL
jgi:hypothetical protein